MALDYSYFLSGRGLRDIPEAVEDSGACEGTGRLGPPLEMDGPVPDAPRTASVTDDPVVAEPAMVEDEPPGQEESGVTREPGGQDELSPLEVMIVRGNTLTEEEEARRAALEESAVAFARAGWRVHPCWWIRPDGTCACPKEPGKCKPGKHPLTRHWKEEASSDPDVVRWWWRKCDEPLSQMDDWYPLANIAVVQDEDRTFALDEDPDNGGDVTLQEIQDRLGADGEIPETLIVRTGSGGRHFYFLQPEGRPVGNLKLGPGLETKGRGGYVIAPPSVTDKGGYSTILDRPPAEPPQWLMDMIGEHRKQQRGEPSKIAVEAVPTGRIGAYRRRAMARNKEELATCAEGDRNNTLNHCAWNLGQLAPAGITSEDECRAMLYEAASVCGMSFVNDGVEASFNSGWRAGLKEPFWPDWATEDDESEFPMRTWDHFGLADRLVDRFAEQLRWGEIPGRWMSWQSGRWQADSKLAGEWMARPMIEAMSKEEASQYSDEATVDEDGVVGDSPRKKFEKWVRSCRNYSSMAGAAAVAKASQLMRIDLNACDTNPMWVNCRNGVIDAATMEFHQHEPNQLLTLQSGVSYNPNAICPAWDAFFEQVQPEETMREYLYRLWGYSMTGDFSEQAVFINHGVGANGKSVAMDVLSMIIGGYAQVVPIETLLTSRNKQGRIPNDVARMQGRRFLKCSESAEGRRLDEPLIKQLTGGEEVVARFMRSEYFEFRMQGKIHLTSNYLNHISDDDATWRRVHLIPWPVIIPEEQQDKYLARRLYEEEAAGIFNKLLAGLAGWRASKGLRPPDAAKKAVQAYREKEDTLGQAIAELFEVDMTHTECTARCSNHLVTRSAEYLFEEYRRWAGQEAKGRTTFYAKLEARGFIRGEHKRKAMFPQIQGRFAGQ